MLTIESIIERLKEACPKCFEEIQTLYDEENERIRKSQELDEIDNLIDELYNHPVNSEVISALRMTYWRSKSTGLLDIPFRVPTDNSDINAISLYNGTYYECLHGGLSKLINETSGECQDLLRQIDNKINEKALKETKTI